MFVAAGPDGETAAVGRHIVDIAHDTQVKCVLVNVEVSRALRLLRIRKDTIDAADAFRSFQIRAE